MSLQTSTKVTDFIAIRLVSLIPRENERQTFSLPSQRMFLRETSVAVQMRLLCLSPGAMKVMNGTVTEEGVWKRAEKDLCNKL